MESTIDRLYVINEDGVFYLHAEYIQETDRYIKRIIIPNILLPVSGDFVVRTPLVRTYENDKTIDIGFGDLPLRRGEVFHKGERFKDVYSVEYIEEKKQVAKKMTLSEIEKKLGHKFELVSEED